MEASIPRPPQPSVLQHISLRGRRSRAVTFMQWLEPCSYSTSDTILFRMREGPPVLYSLFKAFRATIATIIHRNGALALSLSLLLPPLILASGWILGKS